MKNFDWEAFKRGELAYNAKTEEEANTPIDGKEKAAPDGAAEGRKLSRSRCLLVRLEQGTACDLQDVGAVSAKIRQQRQRSFWSDRWGRTHVTEQRGHPIEGLLDLADLLECIEGVFDLRFLEKHLGPPKVC